MSIKLEIDSNGFEVCPYCSKALYTSWDNEYGYPEVGEQQVMCPNCGSCIYVCVDISIRMEKLSGS